MDAESAAISSSARVALQNRTIALNAADEAVQVKGNVHAIADALRNLIENAVAHSPPRTEVTVTTGHDGSLSVADEGPGIAPEDRERIFDRFWRGRGTSSSGAGLGLPIVQEIMKAHGGSVTVEDRPAGGAIFVLHFPLSRERIGKS